jgi:GH3 auxin-responsive promoter
MTGWALILAAARVEREQFARMCEEPQAAQLGLLGKILADNAGCAFGRAHGFEDIETVEAFRTSVPIRDYEGFRPWIERDAGGATNLEEAQPRVLTTAPVVAYEETGGSTSGRKLIPYTEAAFAAFRAAVLPWLGDLAHERSETFAGRAYVAISPVARAPRVTAGGIPIGLASEGAYLGHELAETFASVLAVPAEVAQVQDIDRWRFLTLRSLLAADDLTFISIWSPTFLIGLIEALPALAVPLLKAIRESGADLVRLRTISTALSRDPIDTQLIWPRLATISAWGDGASRVYAQRLQDMFPQAHLQPKGLLATEGAITLPWQGAAVPALMSAFLEFIDDDDEASLCDELLEGASYRVVMTTPGGLYRYDLGDRVRCTGHIGVLPRLEFIGRAGIASDIVGEKLSEDFVGSALDRVGGTACLAARATATPFYELLIDAHADDDLTSHAALIEQRLRTNPQYAYARELGQLGPVVPRAVERLLDRYTQVQAQRGCRLADIKPPVLIGDPASYDALIGANAP